MEQRIKADGVLYNNKYKDSPNKPDVTGELILSREVMRQLVSQIKEGKDAGLRIALWHRESKAGNPYHYVSFEPVVPRVKQENGYQRKSAPAQASKVEEDFNDDIPF